MSLVLRRRKFGLSLRLSGCFPYAVSLGMVRGMWYHPFISLVRTSMCPIPIRLKGVVCFGFVGWDDMILITHTVHFPVVEFISSPVGFSSRSSAQEGTLLHSLPLPIPPGPTLPTALLTFSQLWKGSWDFLRSAYPYIALLP